jgi:hypothetical protein
LTFGSIGSAAPSSNLNKNLRRYEFAEFSPKDFELLGISRAELRRWDNAHKTKAKEQLEAISYRFSELVELASIVAPIKIKYVSKIKVVEAESCMALGKSNCIILSDSFFLSSEDIQIHCLIHELVHLADADYFVAYSKAWVDFYVSHLGQKGFPNGNVREALAECLAFYCEQKKFPGDKNFCRSFACELLHSSPAHKEWCFLMTIAKMDLQAGDNLRAIEVLKKAERAVSNKPMTHHYLACSYVRLNDRASALKETTSLISAFEQLKLPMSDTMLIGSLRTIAMNINNSDKIKHRTSKSILDPFIKRNRADKRILLLAEFLEPG